MKKKFSIIMPVYNRADIVTTAIESVLAQSFKDYELLIIDDGSTDDLKSAVQPLLSEQIIYHERAHQGVCAARNFGLKQADGDYIAYLDSDNMWHPDFLLKMNAALEKPRTPPEAAYSRCNRFKKDPQTGEIRLDSVIGERFDLRKLVAGNYIDLNTFVHTKQCASGQVQFDEGLKRLNDWDFILKITSAHTPVFVNEILVDYYHDLAPNTITGTEDYIGPMMTIKKRFKKYDDRNITVFHDALSYHFENVPEKKYYNYLKMSHRGDYNTTDFTAHGFPYILQIEPTNMCNLSCTVCPAAANKRELKRDRKHLTLEEFKKIVDDMEDYLLLLVMWDWGEPFMNPEFPEMIKYAASKGIKTVTSTNAHFLHNKEYLERILTSGLTTLITAIDSLDADHYAFYRRGGNLSKAMVGLNNVLTLKRKLKSKTLVNLRMVIMKSNESELEGMRKMAKRLKVDRFTVKTANPTRGVDFNDEKIVPDNPRYRRYVYKPGTYERVRLDVNCTKAWFMMNIHTNGNVVACCYDYDQEMIAGNVFERPFREVWNGPAACALRRKLHYDKDSIHKCRECDVNFKMNENGWFVEMHEFNFDLKTRILKNVKEIAKRVLPENAVEMIRGR